MEIPLLQTKLYIPPIRPSLVSRPRLIERLNTGRHRKLTLISAPAGFGKTTLVSEWVSDFRLSILDFGSSLAEENPIQNQQSEIQNRVAWLSLDEDDNDPARFLSYVVAALQTIDASIGKGVLGALQSPQPPPVEAVSTTLLNEIATALIDLTLVLDDYHLIQVQSIHDALTFLLDHLPPTLHLVLITRADPPLPIARLRGRGQLLELRQADLRFTSEEAAEFFNQAMELNLATEDIVTLESRTEGWIVGLHLAALSLQDRDDTHAFITAFSGEHHYVLEYLTEEVVRRQPEPLRRFLLQTSILDRLCGSLCNAVTGESDGEAMLAYLRQHNLFVFPLDDVYHWYRYHHLFADLLGNLLRKAYSPEHIQELHRRACEWYDQNGLAAEAVNHALVTKDYERVAQLIERDSHAMVSRGELTTLLRWIEALPDDVAHSRPWLCIHQAWPLTLSGRADAAEVLLQQIERQVPLEDLSPEGEEILGHVATMRSMMAMMRGDMPQTIELALRADALLPSDNVIPRNTIFFTLSTAYYAEGQLEKTGQAIAEVLRLGRVAGNVWMVVRSLCDLADLRIVQGQLRGAVELVQEALQWAEARGLRQLGTVGYALVKLGEICYERNDLVAAGEHVMEGVNLMQGWQQPYEMVSGYTALARVLQAQNDDAGALEALQKAETMRAQRPNYYRLDSILNSCRIRLCLAQDGPEEAARQAIEIRLGETAAHIFREQEQMLLARVFIAQQRWDEALRLLDQPARETETGGRLGRLIEILALQAVAWQRQGSTAQALGALEKALMIGKPEGYVRVFVDLGAPMARLLQQAFARGVAADYVGRLLAAFGAEEKESAFTPLSPESSDLVEPLTERELEVLHFLGEGYSNQKIATALVITLNTVKKHTSGIYGKLGVHSRTQAVVRAQELGIL